MSDELTNSATSGTVDVTEAMETETEAVTPPAPSGQTQEAQQPSTSANIAAMIQGLPPTLIYSFAKRISSLETPNKIIWLLLENLAGNTF